MGLAEKLSEVDNELSSLGNAPGDLAQRVRAQWGARSLDAIDQELQALSAGVTLVDKPSPALLRASVPDVPAARISFDSAMIPAAIATPSFTPSAMSQAPASAANADAEDRESEYPTLETAAGIPSLAPSMPEPTSSFSRSSEPTSSFGTDFSEPTASFGTGFSDPPASAPSDTPFVPTLPSQPPPAMETEVGRGERRRSLTMSEPPLSEPPMPEAAASSDLDPFDGKPAPIPVPQRAPSVWPMAPAPKRTPSRTIRTSAAPPPPLPPTSLRPRPAHPFDAPVRRPSDTPDPFAPLNRASSRPPAKLDGDDLFAGISASPPAGDAPLKLSAPPAPKLPARAPQASNTVPASAAEEEDVELVVDDDMMEIDVEEIE